METILSFKYTSDVFPYLLITQTSNYPKQYYTTLEYNISAKKVITSARRYSMRPRGICQALNRIDTRHLKAPSTFERCSFAVRIVVFNHDQPGIVNAD